MTLWLHFAKGKQREAAKSTFPLPDPRS